MMWGQVWRSREDVLRDELVSAVMGKVEEHLLEVKEWMNKNMRVLEKMAMEMRHVAEKVDLAASKVGSQEAYAIPTTATEEGKIPTHPFSYAQALQTGIMLSHIQCPKYNAVI